MLIDLIYLIVGLSLLYFGGELLIIGSIRIAKHFKVSPFIVGATIMGFGTSAPELFVSILAALRGSTELAVGNVVGSNIANVALVLGLTTFIAPLAIDPVRLKKETPPLLIATFLASFLLWNHYLGVSEASLMLVCLVIYLYKILSDKDESADSIEDEEKYFPNAKLYVQFLLVLGGLIFLILGADAMVKGSVHIARSMGVSEWLIGITIISIGTSLPEIVSTMMSASRGHSEMALGNVFGSNIFNLFLVLSGTALIKPLEIKETVHFDLFMMMAITILLLVLIKVSHQLRKKEGFVLLTVYGVYVGIKSAGVF